jgi:cholesterol transport system auxiliary component
VNTTFYRLRHLALPVTVALALAAGTLLAGCASKGPPPALYDFGPLVSTSAAPGSLTPAPVNPAPQAAPLTTLVMADATGPEWLDSQRMYYRLLYADAQQARPYAYNRWNGTPLQLLTQRLRSRMAEGGIKVLSTTDAAAGEALLRIEVEDFSHNYTSASASSGQVTLRASLFRGHRLLDQKTFSRNTSATSADALGGAIALAAASDAVAAELLAWLATQPPATATAAPRG